ncbi:hypothetical protein D3C78_1893110 [compost metagenome]
MPSSAVTIVVSAFGPTESEIVPDAAPDTTVTPLTVIVASGSLAAGVTVNDVVA